MLTPGVDVWRDGDESLENGYAFDSGADFEPHPYPKGHIVGGFNIGRRPIPENVRRSMAWHHLFRKLGSNATNPVNMEILGGWDEVLKNTAEGDGAYTRWVLS